MCRISARHAGPISCPHCKSQRLRLKDKRMREPRHESWGLRHCILELESCKYRCKDCGRSFWQRLPGILPRKRATEPFRRSVFVAHFDGVNRSRLGQRADRFHVIRLINHHFLACWREIDPVGSKHRGLLSLMRRHRHKLRPEQHPKLEAYWEQFPALREIYRFKQKLCYLLLKKHRTRKKCIPLVQRFLQALSDLSQAKLAQLVQLGETWPRGRWRSP